MHLYQFAFIIHILHIHTHIHWYIHTHTCTCTTYTHTCLLILKVYVYTYLHLLYHACSYLGKYTHTHICAPSHHTYMHKLLSFSPASTHALFKWSCTRINTNYHMRCGSFIWSSYKWLKSSDLVNFMIIFMFTLTFAVKCTYININLHTWYTHPQHIQKLSTHVTLGNHWFSVIIKRKNCTLK